ncbi:MarR family transcriptional regulator [Mesorhizobium sp. CAU 1741]|uniref:MarR family winged helix-turn-helix transcriptional regulator n=1 Tax=Mesorhizobium sp. CAU 1741 TaxID=3140366 RepID=UPI00325AB7F3
MTASKPRASDRVEQATGAAPRAKGATTARKAASSDEKESTFVLHKTPNYLFWCLHKTSMSVVTEELERAGTDITPVQYAALIGVQSYPGIDQGSLAQIIGYDRATIGGVIDRLEKKGLVDRRIHEQDRRARVLFLAPAGEELLPRLEDKVAEAQTRILAPLPEHERDRFLSMVAKLLSDDLPHAVGE